MNRNRTVNLERYKEFAKDSILNDNHNRTADGKRHDRIGEPEMRIMIAARKDHLSDEIIASIFHRSRGGVRKALERQGIRHGSKGALTISIIEVSDAVTTRKRGQSVYFRLNNVLRNHLIAEEIWLEVLSCKPHDQMHPIEGLIKPHRVDIKIDIANAGEYRIPGRYKLIGQDTEDFEVFCKGKPGYTYLARIKINCSRPPGKATLPVYSESFELIYYRPSEHPPGLKSTIVPSSVLVAESLGPDLKRLEKGSKRITNGDDVELRLFFKDRPPDELVDRITASVTQSGTELLRPVVYDSGIIFVSFKYSTAALVTLSRLDIPPLYGWQFGLFSKEVSRLTDDKASGKDMKQVTRNEPGKPREPGIHWVGGNLWVWE